MRIVSTVLALALLAAPISARADDFPEASPQTVAELAPRIDAFFTQVQAADATGAYQGPLDGSLIEGRTIEISQLVAQTTTIAALLGRLDSWEMFDSECASERICLVKYAGYFEHGAIGVWMRFYRNPSGQWVLTSIYFGDTAEYFS